MYKLLSISRTKSSIEKQGGGRRGDVCPPTRKIKKNIVLSYFIFPFSVYLLGMDNIFFIACIISLVFLVFKFIEMRFVDKESKPLKYLIRDTLLVYASVILGSFVLDQLRPVLNEVEGITGGGPPAVFVDNPSF